MLSMSLSRQAGNKDRFTGDSVSGNGVEGERQRRELSQLEDRRVSISLILDLPEKLPIVESEHTFVDAAHQQVLCGSHKRSGKTQAGGFDHAQDRRTAC
jgi:hypothetical protein